MNFYAVALFFWKVCYVVFLSQLTMRANAEQNSFAALKTSVQSSRNENDKK